MSLVMSVAAIDAYMHWTVIRRISQVRRRGDLPKSLLQLEVPFSEVTAAADRHVEAQRMKRKVRPWVAVMAALQECLLKRTFQSFDQVATALAMAGVDKPWNRIATEMGEDRNAIKSRLNNLVHRRNQIVHEGDLKRLERPRELRFNSLGQEEALTQVDWIEKLIHAIENIASAS